MPMDFRDNQGQKEKEQPNSDKEPTRTLELTVHGLRYRSPDGK